jgi:hypothetical protein
MDVLKRNFDFWKPFSLFCVFEEKGNAKVKKVDFGIESKEKMLWMC